MILRRALLFALVAVLAAGAGLAARELRGARADRSAEEPPSGVAAAPSASPAPKWSTRRLEIPPDLAVWSIRISPDGAAIAGVTKQPPAVGTCVAVDKVSPPSCQPPVPSRVLRYRVDDPAGAITATLTRTADAPENGGLSWLRDGGLVVAVLDLVAPGAKVGPKTYSVTVIEPDGKVTSLGSLPAASFPPTALSPDGRWLAFLEASSAQVRFIERHTGSSKTVPLGDVGLQVALGWAPDGGVLFGKDSTLLRVSRDGAIDRVAGPEGARLAGVASVSPDGQVVVFRAHRPQAEGLAAFVAGRWVDIPLDALRSSTIPTWLNAREILMRTAAGALQAYDPRTAATRDLGFTIRAADPRVLAYSEPYLMWRDGDAGRIHLLDTRSAYDALVGVSDVTGVQPYAGGGFLILHQDGAALLTGADWFARVPATAAPFVSAAPLRPGTKDPFADIAALPRLDQFASGGALEIVSKTGSLKRVRSQEGGWSLEMPLEWRAEVGRLRGGEIYSFDPTGRGYSGNAPSPGEGRMSITLWPDFEKRDAQALTSGVRSSRASAEPFGCDRQGREPARREAHADACGT